MDRITDHETDAKSLLSGVLQKPRIKGMVGAFASRVQNAEDGLWTVLDSILFSAEGALLDEFAALLGEPRGQLSDAGLRRLLYGKIRILRSKGTADDILEALRAIVRAGHTLTFVDAFPAGLSIVSVGYNADLADAHPRIARLLARGKAAGVRMWYTAQVGTPQCIGILNSEADPDPDSASATGGGWSFDSSVGGKGDFEVAL